VERGKVVSKGEDSGEGVYDTLVSDNVTRSSMFSLRPDSFRVSDEVMFDEGPVSLSCLL
jgi:hypothetical protein